MNVKYYPINEDAAKRAKDANSYFDYLLRSPAVHQVNTDVSGSYRITGDTLLEMAK